MIHSMSLGSRRSVVASASRQQNQTQKVSSRPLVRVKAAAPPTPPPPSPKKSELDQKVDKVVEELKKTGMTASKAKEVLKTWADIGVNDPDQLKKLLVKKSLQPIPTIALQALLDGVASYGGFYLGGLASQGENFPFRIGVEVLGYFFGIYYFVQALLDAGLITGLLYTSYKYGTNSSSLLAAVQAMAGPATGLSIADKAVRTVNIFKVMAALEAVANLLRAEYKETPKDNSLKNLGAYLVLQQAREVLGFNPESYGLTDKEAGNIAYAFSTYDTNSNYKLEATELGDLCASLGKELDNDEAKEALKILDVNKDGFINFNEFVAWWVKKAPTPQPTRV